MPDRELRHLTSRKLLRLLDGRAGAEERRIAFEHMRSCPGCARQFQTAVDAERALGGDFEHVSAVELDALLPGILDEASGSPAPRRFVPAWLALPGLALAAGLAFFLLPDGDAAQPTGDGMGEFHTRGEPDKVPELTVEGLCVREEAIQPLQGSGACPRGASLVVAVKPAPRAGAARLHLVDALGRTHAAGGGPEGAAALVAERDEGVAGVSVDLTDDVAPGPGELVVDVCRSCTVEQLITGADGTRVKLHITVLEAP